MKRSEMVEVIKTWLHDYESSEERSSSLPCYWDADHLLKVIEKAGMAPPEKIIFKLGGFIVSKRTWERTKYET